MGVDYMGNKRSVIIITNYWLSNLRGLMYINITISSHLIEWGYEMIDQLDEVSLVPTDNDNSFKNECYCPYVLRLG